MHSINGASNIAAELDKGGEIPEVMNTAIDLTDSTPQLKVLSNQPSKIKYKYELCVSKFEPDETEKNLVAHIMKNTRIEDENLFNVEKLVKTKARLDKLSFVSFKIGTDLENVNDMIANPALWPEIEIKRFIQHTDAELKSLKAKSKSNPPKKSIENKAPKKKMDKAVKVQEKNTPINTKTNIHREQRSYVNRRQMFPAFQHSYQKYPNEAVGNNQQMVPVFQHAYQNYPNEAVGNNQHFFYNRLPMTWNPEKISMAQANWIPQQSHAIYRPI